jgi:hypothetical protein
MLRSVTNAGDSQRFLWKYGELRTHANRRRHTDTRAHNAYIGSFKRRCTHRITMFHEVTGWSSSAPDRLLRPQIDLGGHFPPGVRVGQSGGINFVFFALLVSLILRGQSGWFWRNHRTWGFLYRSICHLGLLLTRVSFVRDVPDHSGLDPFPCSFSSTFCLIGTCWVFMLEFHRLFYSS